MSGIPKPDENTFEFMEFLVVVSIILFLICKGILIGSVGYFVLGMGVAWLACRLYLGVEFK